MLVFSRDVDREICLEELAHATIEAEELQAEEGMLVSWGPRRCVHSLSAYVQGSGNQRVQCSSTLSNGLGTRQR